jgi:hypothetical protein
MNFYLANGKPSNSFESLTTAVDGDQQMGMHRNKTINYTKQLLKEALILRHPTRHLAHEIRLTLYRLQVPL